MNKAVWIRAFSVTAVAGLLLWVLGSPGIPTRFLGLNTNSAVIPIMGFFRDYNLVLLAAVAAVAGYLKPNGFWLWGMAAVSLRLFANFGFTMYLAFSGDLDVSSDLLTAREVAGVAVLEVVTQLFVAVLCTGAALAAAGLRLVVDRVFGNP